MKTSSKENREMVEYHIMKMRKAVLGLILICLPWSLYAEQKFEMARLDSRANAGSDCDR
ncbi:MAG TPA: hypothetical protein VM779_12490 [Thermoanaerobaculia bacterium]|nr:hypothetical protein [Thermoanaerobaculia bacterium]